MSIALMTEAWKLQGLTSTQKLVLLSLADNANDQGECYPSIAQVSTRTCLSERAVRNAIRDLEDMGYVRSVSRLGTSTMYHLSTSPVSDAPPARRAAPAANAPRHQMPPTPAPDAPPPRHDVPPTPARGAPKPSFNRQLNRQLTQNKGTGVRPKVSREELLELQLPDWLPAQSWEDWVDHRIEVKSPLTLKAAGMALRHLSRLRDEGNDPVLVIEQSVRSGKWTDLYAVKQQVHGRQTSTGQPALNKQEALEERNREIALRWAERSVG